MRENKYDDPVFFEQYGKMPRSEKGLAAAGEWRQFRAMFPDLAGKRVLDLGCGYGWHCRYAAEMGAAHVLGTDISERMLAEAKRRTSFPNVQYRLAAIEDVALPEASFDVVVSSLALHYVRSFPDVAVMVRRILAPGGHFVFSVEHPVFTAQGPQQWFCDAEGNRLHWPVDDYFREGGRQAAFLGETVTKYHRTLTTYVSGLLDAGFELTGLTEPTPSQELLDAVPEMRDELRRPMMLLASARCP